MQHLAALLALLFALLHSSAAAAPGSEVTAAESTAARALIEAQLAAFAIDDAEAAFAHAAPSIQRRFETADAFVAMVREAYPVVWRPAAVAFLRIGRDGDGLIQSVRMSDAEGGIWLVLYRLERQPGDNWRIAACQIARSPGRSV